MLVLSNGDPTAYWWLERRGTTGRTSLAWWRRSPIRPPVVVLQRRRAAPEKIAPLALEIEGAGYRLLVDNEVALVWLRGPP